MQRANHISFVHFNLILISKQIACRTHLSMQVGIITVAASHPAMLKQKTEAQEKKHTRTKLKRANWKYQHLRREKEITMAQVAIQICRPFGRLLRDKHSDNKMFSEIKIIVVAVITALCLHFFSLRLSTKKRYQETKLFAINLHILFLEIDQKQSTRKKIRNKLHIF